MKQVLHLLVFDVEHDRVLAANCGSRWMLPVLTCDERTRALPGVARWVLERGIHGDVAGQWLGRVTDDAIDWLLPIAVEPARASTVASSFEWRALDALASSASVIEYQQWALARTLASGPLPCVDGPFGNLCWPQDVRAWIGAAAGSPVVSLTPFRCSAHEIVVGANCGSTRVYFKGLTDDRASEARITRALAGVEPDSFARTIATARRPDGSVWWLTAECAGRPGGSVSCVAQALARIQRRVIETHPAGVPCEPLRFERMVRWASSLLDDSPGREAIGRASTRLRLAGTTPTWIPMDLDATNVLVDECDRARFIDVDDSFLGSAPLAMATLAMRCRDRTVYHTYERTWPAALARLDWPTVETAAAVIHAWLGWHRLERNIARGEVFVDRALATARIRARLVKAIG